MAIPSLQERITGPLMSPQARARRRKPEKQVSIGGRLEDRLSLVSTSWVLCRRSVVYLCAFLTLSVVQFDVAPVFGGKAASALQFVGGAEARPGGPHRFPAHGGHTAPGRHHRPVDPRYGHNHVHAGYRRPVAVAPRRTVVIAPVRPIPAVPPWYWGSVVAGVTVGAVIAVAAAGSAPRAPSSELCWYWTNSSMTRGYWSYCTAPGSPR